MTALLRRRLFGRPFEFTRSVVLGFWTTEYRHMSAIHNVNSLSLNVIIIVLSMLCHASILHCLSALCRVRYIREDTRGRRTARQEPFCFYYGAPIIQPVVLLRAKILLNAVFLQVFCR